MAMSPHPQYFTVEAYLEHEVQTGIKHEYIDGEIYAMTGGTEQHSLIIANCMITLGQQIRGGNCRLYNSDMRVKISESRFVYPDLTVACGESTFADENRTMLTNPALVVEVMSKSSADYDRGSKGEFYRNLPALQAYLLLDQDRIYAQLYTRTSDGWLLRDFYGVGTEVPLDCIAARLNLDEAYSGVQLPRK